MPAFTVIDFLIGFFLMNAMPHMLMGILNVRFLSLFGFSAGANYRYAVFNVVAAAALFQADRGLDQLGDNGIVVGAASMLAIYALTGRFFVRLFAE